MIVYRVDGSPPFDHDQIHEEEKDKVHVSVYEHVMKTGTLYSVDIGLQ